MGALSVRVRPCCATDSARLVFQRVHAGIREREGIPVCLPEIIG